MRRTKPGARWKFTRAQPGNPCCFGHVVALCDVILERSEESYEIRSQNGSLRDRATLAAATAGPAVERSFALCSAQALWNPTLVAKSATRMGHPSSKKSHTLQKKVILCYRGTSCAFFVCLLLSSS